MIEHYIYTSNLSKSPEREIEKAMFYEAEGVIKLVLSKQLKELNSNDQSTNLTKENV